MTSQLVMLAVFFAGAAAMTATVIRFSWPWLRNYAMARPNARSSHKTPTPQGGGFAVVGTTLVLAAVAIAWTGSLSPMLITAFAGTVWLAAVGAIDDVRPIEAVPRLFLQCIAVAALLIALPDGFRAIPLLPWWSEQILLFVAVLWFVNLVNFMDGIDWMTVAEVVPVTAGLFVLGSLGALPQEATTVALLLCGSVVGFAPFNKPVARLFLGDVGSLPIGFLLAWLLLLMASRGYLAAALLLPLYYLADATVTLLVRSARGEPILQAHRSHFYQRALDNGYSVSNVVASVTAVNVMLIALASVAVLSVQPALQLSALCVGCLLVGGLLVRFSRTKA